MYHSNVNVSFMVKRVIQIKSGITINVGVSVKIQKNIMRVKNYILNRATCTCENSKYLRSITDHLLIAYNEIIDTLAKSYSDSTKIVPAMFSKQRLLVKQIITIFYLLYHSIIDSPLYLLLPDNTTVKVRWFITISRHQQVKRN